MKAIKIIIFVLFASAFFIFILENFKILSQPFQFQFDLKFWGVESYSLPLGFYFCIVFLAGFIAGILFMAFRKFKRKA
jgi:uncharacterized integral membrane protein